MAKTVFIVTLLSCIERGLGFVYRIFLSRTIGSEGLGLYQIALSVIGVLITLSASGIPITVSRLMIKERALHGKSGENKAVSAGVITSAIVSTILCLFFFIFKRSLNFIFADSRCNVLFMIILPGVVLTSVYAVIRGFFWGTKSFYTYSFIELAEEIIMIICGVFLILKGNSIFQKTVYASVAVLLSYLFSFTTSSAIFVAKGGRMVNPKEQLKPLITSSTPITFMRAGNSLTSSLIAIILPSMLISSGLDKQTAISQFGIISGMSLPLLFIPSTLIGSLSLVVSPELSENYYKKKKEKIKNSVEKSLLYSLVISVLIIPVFIGCGKYVCQLLYNNALAGTYLQRSAFIMLPMSITIISTSLLNSMGFEKRTLLYFMIGALFLILSIVFLPKHMGNNSLILGYFLNYTLTACLNLKLLKKVCNHNLIFNDKLLKSILICIVTSVFCYLFFSLLSKIILQFFALIIATIITLICIYLCLYSFKIFSLKDLKK